MFEGCRRRRLLYPTYVAVLVLSLATARVVDARAPERSGGTTALPFVTFDQVIPDDLIVQGSLCVGFDCVNNENFGFDTIRLKENNLRIHFEDTSAGTFPTNDWGIEVNSSLSGGASYFSVIDRTGSRNVFRIDAGAPNDAVRVDSSGRLGLRTPTPVLDVHARTGNTPAIRLEQTNASGWSAQTWDIGANEANFFLRDVTSGSRLPLRVRPGAPTSSLDISSSGDVGVGTASPSTRLHVAGSARLDGHLNFTSGPNPAAPPSGAMNLFLTATSTAWFQSPDGALPFGVQLGGFAAGGGALIDGVLRLGWGSGAPIPPLGNIQIWHQSTDGSLNFRFSTGTTAQLTSAGVWTDASSRSFKRDVRPLRAADAADALNALAPVRYFPNGTADEHVGFIAEDVPDLVATQGRQGLAPMDIVAVLTKVVQGQQKRIDDLAAELAALKAAVARAAGGGK